MLNVLLMMAFSLVLSVAVWLVMRCIVRNSPTVGLSTPRNVATKIVGTSQAVPDKQKTDNGLTAEDIHKHSKFCSGPSVTTPPANYTDISDCNPGKDYANPTIALATGLNTGNETKRVVTQNASQPNASRLNYDHQLALLNQSEDGRKRAEDWAYALETELQAHITACLKAEACNKQLLVILDGLVKRGVVDALSYGKYRNCSRRSPRTPIGCRVDSEDREKETEQDMTKLIAVNKKVEWRIQIAVDDGSHTTALPLLSNDVQELKTRWSQNETFVPERSHMINQDHDNEFNEMFRYNESVVKLSFDATSSKNDTDSSTSSLSHALKYDSRNPLARVRVESDFLAKFHGGSSGYCDKNANIYARGKSSSSEVFVDTPESSTVCSTPINTVKHTKDFFEDQTLYKRLSQSGSMVKTPRPRSAEVTRVDRALDGMKNAASVGLGLDLHNGGDNSNGTTNGDGVRRAVCDISSQNGRYENCGDSNKRPVSVAPGELATVESIPIGEIAKHIPDMETVERNDEVSDLPNPIPDIGVLGDKEEEQEVIEKFSDMLETFECNGKVSDVPDARLEIKTVGAGKVEEDINQVCAIAETIDRSERFDDTPDSVEHIYTASDESGSSEERVGNVEETAETDLPVEKVGDDPDPFEERIGKVSDTAAVYEGQLQRSGSFRVDRLPEQNGAKMGDVKDQ